MKREVSIRNSLESHLVLFFIFIPLLNIFHTFFRVEKACLAMDVARKASQRGHLFCWWSFSSWGSTFKSPKLPNKEVGQERGHFKLKNVFIKLRTFEPRYFCSIDTMINHQQKCPRHVRTEDRLQIDRMTFNEFY